MAKTPTRGVWIAIGPLALLVGIALLTRLSTPARETEPTPLPLRSLRSGGEAVSDQERQEMERVVRSYVEALSRKDFRGALALASPTFRQLWTEERFRQMIRVGYAPLLSARGTTLDDVRRIGDEARATVAVRGAGENVYRYEYVLVRAQGRWSVESGVSIDPTGAPAP